MSNVKESMLKDEIPRACMLCGNDTKSGIHKAVYYDTNETKVKQEVISYCCQEHFLQVRKMISNREYY